MRPSGAHTIDQGTSRLPITVSTRKLTCPGPDFCGVVSTSPAPRPGGGCPQDSTSRVSKQNTANTIRFILRRLQGPLPVHLYPLPVPPFPLFKLSVGCIHAAA